MATVEHTGFADAERVFGALQRDMTRKIVAAGSLAAEKRMREDIREKQHIRNGDMLAAVGPNDYREWLGGGAQDVYPHGDDRRGVRNATKAYVINYGKGKRPYTKWPKGKRRRNLTGDKFITGNEEKTEKAVEAAMEAEYDRLLEEALG